MQIKSKEINKVANITKYRARDGHHLKYNPIADFALRVDNEHLQIIAIEGEGTVCIFGLKKE